MHSRSLSWSPEMHLFVIAFILLENLLVSAFTPCLHSPLKSSPRCLSKVTESRRLRSSIGMIRMEKDQSQPSLVTVLPGMQQVLFIEMGFGADQHGQDITKAAVRACRNAIEFNSIPSISSIIPGGYADMALRISLAVPRHLARQLDLDKIKAVFPYGRKHIIVQDGGGVFTSGIALAAMGDVTDEMLMAVAHVAVGEAGGAAEGEEGVTWLIPPESEGGGATEDVLQLPTGAGVAVTQVQGMAKALFIETGFGADQHGQDPTKAAIRACRSAMEFNSIPCVRSLIPGGYDGMRVRVTLAVPAEFVDRVDKQQVAETFPFGEVDIAVQAGGGKFTSGTRNRGLGDKTDEMLVALAHVVVGAASWPASRLR